MADFTVGALGVLCLWFRGNFWLATAIAEACWLLGDAIGHVRQVINHNDHAPDNSGLFLYLEFVMPLVILVLTLYHRSKSAIRTYRSVFFCLKTEPQSLSTILSVDMRQLCKLRF